MEDCAPIDDINPSLTDIQYPILLLPQTQSMLTTSSGADSILIEVKITSQNIEGSLVQIYSGPITLKILDNFDLHLHNELSTSSGSPRSINFDQMPLNAAESNNQSTIWVDPMKSPYVYNQSKEMEEFYPILDSDVNHITVQQHNTYITQNIYNCDQATGFDSKKVRKVIYETNNNNTVEAYNIYEAEEYECGVFLSQLSNEILMNEKAKEEPNNYKHDDKDFKKLESNKNAKYDGSKEDIVEYNEIKEEPLTPKSPYSCKQCHQEYKKKSALEDHILNKHYSEKFNGYQCYECGKKLKTMKMYDVHCMRHGDPDVECSKCHKVFASKTSLRVHRKIHNRKYKCTLCPRTYAKKDQFDRHCSKVHGSSILSKKFQEYIMDENNFEANEDSNFDIIIPSPEGHDVIVQNEFIKGENPVTEKSESNNEYEGEKELNKNQTEESVNEKEEMERENEKIVQEVVNNNNLLDKDYEFFIENIDEEEKSNEVSLTSDSSEKADYVITKVMTGNLLFNAKAKKFSRIKHKICDVCHKVFDRLSDLKRHLIEHVVKSTLAKNPVDTRGVLTIHCEVCQKETFHKIDQYKAHLREHAKLTMYKCYVCGKTFSDSSNYCKHKKIHSNDYYQCDLCNRKFNTKKMIEQHMSRHDSSNPIQCEHCGKRFYFESMLNKHIRISHQNKLDTHKCKICIRYFPSVKCKWEHEWDVHNMRYLICDCRLCGDKFRKYRDLKSHCLLAHGVPIPTKKFLIQLKKRYDS